jgi:hypothetical protein
MPTRPAAKAKASTKKTYRPRLVRDRDLRRVIRSVEKMGKPVSRVDVAPDGRFSVFIGAPTGDQTNTDQTNNPWDQVLTGGKD